MSSLNAIPVDKLARLIGTPQCPVPVDVREGCRKANLPTVAIPKIPALDKQGRTIWLTRFSSILLAGAVVVLGTMPTIGKQVCKPHLSFEEVRFSEVKDLQRKWSAVLVVDASRCATISGHFDIKLIRIKEMTPDLPFTEQFTWTPGKTEVSLQFWLDEAVLEYSIGTVAPCPCRDQERH